MVRSQVDAEIAIDIPLQDLRLRHDLHFPRDLIGSFTRYVA